MTFTINRKQLAAELALLQTVAERKGTIPVLSHTLFSIEDGVLTLTATDRDSTMITQLDVTGEAWSGCVPSRPLHDLVRLLYDEEIRFTPKPNDRIEIKCGTSRHVLPFLAAKDFPAFEKLHVETVTMDGPTLSTALGRAVKCISLDTNDVWSHGVSLRSMNNSVFVVASNSRHLAVTEIPSALEIDVLVPLKTANALIKFLSGDVEVGASKNSAVFRQGTRMMFTRLLDARFPDWPKLFPEAFTHTITVATKSLEQAFRLAAITAHEAALIPIPLRLTASKTELKVETSETDRGHSCEVLPIDCPTLNGDSLNRGINGGHFLIFLENTKDVSISFNSDFTLFQLTFPEQPTYRYLTIGLKS